MPTAQQRPPPPPRAERSTGKGAKVKGTPGVAGKVGVAGGRGFKFKATVSVCIFNSRATPSQHLHFHLEQRPRPHVSISSFYIKARRVEVGPRSPSGRF